MTSNQAFSFVYNKLTSSATYSMGHGLKTLLVQFVIDTAYLSVSGVSHGQSYGTFNCKCASMSPSCVHVHLPMCSWLGATVCYFQPVSWGMSLTECMPKKLHRSEQSRETETGKKKGLTLQRLTKWPAKVRNPKCTQKVEWKAYFIIATESKKRLKESVSRNLDTTLIQFQLYADWNC